MNDYLKGQKFIGGNDKLTFNDKVGVLDPNGINANPLTGNEYSEEYKKISKQWSSLPAFAAAEEILESIAQVPLIFVISGTGSGKSVLIPKLALHYNNYSGRIAMTLPKKVVTESAASFSAKTLDVELGKEIGYLYSGVDKSSTSDKNKIVYMTDGYLVMKFIQDPTLSEFQCIIIDEAHERRIQIDLLLLLLKNILASGKRPDLKVIIMSATINGDKYKKYFAGIDSKILNISGQPNHPIETFFLNKPSNSYMVDGLELINKIINEQVKKDTLFFITTSGEALQICKNIRPKYPKVFCAEAFAGMENRLKDLIQSRDKYLETGDYNQKLIIATNVAESSLTLDGLKCVIDSGYELYSYFNPDYYGNVLEKKLISKAQALQRRGRVGRTEPGTCFHLLTEKQFNALEEYPAPDITRNDITLDLIKIIQISDSSSLAEGEEMLSKLMDPPKKQYVDIAKSIIKMYQIVDSDGILSNIGKQITKFSSISINRALFLIFAYQMHCAKEASIILAMLEHLDGKITNLFYRADTICKSNCKNSAGKEFIKGLADKRGDHLTYLNIWTKFRELPDQKVWSKKYGIRIETLYAVTSTSNKYYRKIITSSRIQQARPIGNINVEDNIIAALTASHRHLVASHMEPTFAKKKIEGSINKDSVIHNFYKKKDLINRKFIYDEFISINGNWEYSGVTIMDLAKND